MNSRFREQRVSENNVFRKSINHSSRTGREVETISTYLRYAKFNVLPTMVDRYKTFSLLTVNSIWGVVQSPLTEKKIVKKPANAINVIF